jgi:hypothetical protein
MKLLPMGYKFHKDAPKVIRFMKELDIDPVIQERVYLAMFTEMVSINTAGMIKTKSDEYIETL